MQVGTKETQEAQVACCGGAGITEAVGHQKLCLTYPSVPRIVSGI